MAHIKKNPKQRKTYYSKKTKNKPPTKTKQNKKEHHKAKIDQTQQ